MNESSFHQWLLWAFVALAALSFTMLFFVTAPYGRHEAKAWWGPTIDSRLGWFLMESPSVLVFSACWFFSEHRTEPAPLAFLFLWLLHYVHRAWIYPFRLRSGSKPMPLVIAFFALCFTSTNSYLNGRYLFHFAPPERYGAAWLSDPRFLVGALLFLVGFFINQHADWVLLHLRKPGETGYKIPRGGLYRWVTCPNYLGEIVEWFGFALCTYSITGLVFALWTVANLLPRARSHHSWYLSNFPDYPRERKALLPYLF